MNFVSIMICSRPQLLSDERVILSSSDSVWSPISKIPRALQAFLTDENGNKPATYAGALQMSDLRLLNLVEEYQLFVCIRGVEDEYIDLVDIENNQHLYKNVVDKLELVGWDVCSGNGWLTASSHGVFPIDPFTGDELKGINLRVNRYGLFGSKTDSEKCCTINNTEISDHAPWYPVAVFVTKEALKRIE